MTRTTKTTEKYQTSKKMKNINNISFKQALIYFALIFGWKNVSSQCTNEVSHLTGTMTVNGVNVTVTSTGKVDYLAYCSGTYMVGYSYSSTPNSGDGSYIFTFSPAINGVTINFAGLTNNAGNIEVVSLYVNGSHYAIPSAGSSNGCEALALLTAGGDITGLTGYTLSGWNGTSIAGPITSFEISDVVTNAGGGTIFSLFICDPITNIFDFTDKYQLNIYPNPSSNQLTIEGNIISNSEIEVVNILGKKVNIEITTQSDKAVINTSELAKGIYFVKIKSDNIFHTEKIVIQ